jgi:poly(A) polymerase
MRNDDEHERPAMTSKIQTIDVPAPLAEVNSIYADAGEKLWFVGGCVRDALKGVPCADQDLATTATPERQVAICEAAGLRWIGTGLKHGTITVRAGGISYEITTLRRDVATDGRHAEVEWDTDIATDLGRRDLTINAMAMTFEGRLIDPFLGRRDLERGAIRFVGDATRRIAEDHLRILRWFRFYGRFGRNTGRGNDNREAVFAITNGASLLKDISVERVWSETSKILMGPNTLDTLALMHGTGVLEAIGLQKGDTLRFRAAANQTTDPAALLAFWQGGSAPSILESWKTSGAERDAASFVAARLDAYDVGRAKEDLVDGGRRDLVLALLAAHHGQSAVADVAGWDVPTFPLKGGHLVAAGMTRGKAVGDRLKVLKAAWTASDRTLSAADLLAFDTETRGDAG